MPIARRTFLAGLGASLAVGCARTETPAATPTSVAPAGGSTPTPETIATVPSVPVGTTPPATTSTEPRPTTTTPRWDPDALDELADWLAARDTRTALVLERDEVVFDRTFVGGPGLRSDVASVQKSVVAILLGIARERGLLDFDQPVDDVLGTGWSNSGDEAAITVRHLMSMRAGLDEDLRGFAAPGTVWWYSNSAYHVTHEVLRRSANASMTELSDDWLFGPLGVQPRWEARGGTGSNAVQPDGTPKLGLMCRGSDLAQLGRLVVDAGAAPSGTRVVEADTLDELLAPSSELNPSYGLLWWRNDPRGYLVGKGQPFQDTPLLPSAPSELRAALGANDQKLYVLASEELVVVRLGGRAAPRTLSTIGGFDDEFWNRLMSARR